MAMTHLLPVFDTYLVEPADGAVMTDAATDREAVAAWLFRYKKKATFEVCRKEGLRFLLWVERSGLTLKTLRVEHFSRYWDFLQAPEPRAFWCSSQEPKFTDGHLNPVWVPVKPARIGSAAWRPFVSDLGPAARALARSVIFSLMEFLAITGYVHANSIRADISETPKQSDYIDRYLPEECIDDVLRFLESCDTRDSRRAKFAVIFLALVGLRRAELAKATTRHVFEDKEGLWLKVFGKGDKPAVVPIPAAAFKALNEYRASLGKPAASAQRDDPLLFSLSGHKHVGDASIHAMLKKAFCEAASFLELSDPDKAERLRLASAHWLRHSAATLQLRAGVELSIVQKNMRHNKITTTQRYLHHEREQQQRAMKDFDIKRRPVLE